MKPLPRPTLSRCYFDDGFQPPLPTVCIDWADDGSESSEAVWGLPKGVKLLGPAPVRLGLRIRRIGADLHDVQLLWNSTRLRWSALAWADLQAGSLVSLLAAMGVRLEQLLDAPDTALSEPLSRAA